MSLITLIIAGLILAALLVLCWVLPHPITWLMAAVMAALFFLVLLPKYQGEQQALAHGQTVAAAVAEVRHWQRKVGDGNYEDNYEIIALWPNPHNGQMVRFVSPPLRQNPQAHLPAAVNVTVDTDNPKNYVMDLSFLPKI
ncbi:hypothetical protein [Paralysiella testudinis]|uniref:hypothetical protein n=1 Tax=Paralysiella testudinis TaxID=2809020 RepID=UPI001E5C2B01|nr:hypothetical protein [Paralysiella testudinis]